MSAFAPLSPITLLLASLLAAACVAAHGARPLNTDDAGVLEVAACEIESGATRLRAADERARESSLGGACGIGWKTQLGVGAARTRIDSQRDTAAALSGKTQLWSAGDDGAALTLAYGLSARRDGSRWTQSARDAALVGSWPLGAVTLHANLGHVREVPTRLKSTTWGLAVEHEGWSLGSLRLAPVAEVFGDDRDPAWGALGLRLSVVPDRLSMDASWSRQAGAAKARITSIGLTLSF